MVEKIYRENKIDNTRKSAFLKQGYLIWAELLSLRLNWKWSLLIVLISPLSILFFLYLLAGNNADYMPYAITGNVVMSLVTGTMLTLGQELGVLKQIRGFDYYAALPIRKMNLILAYLIRATVTTMPSILVLMLIGKYVLKIPVSFHPSLLVILFLSGISLAAVGTFIGIYSKNAEQAGILTQVFQPLIVYCAPVFIPQEHMPAAIRWISYGIPTTYVANAVRASFRAEFDWKSIFVLLLFSMLSVLLVEFKMEWRQK